MRARIVDKSLIAFLVLFFLFPFQLSDIDMIMVDEKAAIMMKNE